MIFKQSKRTTDSLGERIKTDALHFYFDQPWFLDGKLTTTFREKPYIDGSFLSKGSDYFSDGETRNQKILKLDWRKDEVLKSKRGFDIVEALSPQGIWGLVDQGKSYARDMEQRGGFKHLERRRDSSKDLFSPDRSCF